MHAHTRKHTHKHARAQTHAHTHTRAHTRDGCQQAIGIWSYSLFQRDLTQSYPQTTGHFHVSLMCAGTFMYTNTTFNERIMNFVTTGILQDFEKGNQNKKR